MIRTATVADIPAILAISRDSYTIVSDWEQTEAWMHRMINHPDCMFVLSDNGYGVATLMAPFWAPGDLQGHMVILASRSGSSGMQGCALVRAMASWAKSRGAKVFRFGSETGIDLGPIARRLGARQNAPNYTMDLE